VDWVYLHKRPRCGDLCHCDPIGCVCEHDCDTQPDDFDEWSVDDDEIEEPTA
jgi:hypothetical protein